MIDRAWAWMGEGGKLAFMCDVKDGPTIGGYANPCNCVLWRYVPIPGCNIAAVNGGNYFGNLVHGRGHWRFNERFEWIQILQGR